MLYSKRFTSALICIAATTAAPAFAVPINLGAAADFNGFFRHNFDSTPNDSQGSLAIGGDANLVGYTVNTLGGSSSALVVGGSFNQTGGDVNGNAIIGGSYSSHSGGSIHGSLTQSQPLPFSFNDTFQSLDQLSHELSLNGVSAANQYGRIDYVGDGDTTQQIFNLAETDFESAWGFFSANMSLDQEIIVNVAGQHIDINPADYLVKAADLSWIGNDSHILYNFFEAETITISSSFHGSILATHADIFAHGGSVNGQVIASSWTGATQLNTPLFAHNQTVQISEVPEPGTLSLLVLGLVGLSAVRCKSKSLA
jgi:choice-of-anchor A domain-containing protein